MGRPESACERRSEYDRAPDEDGAAANAVFEGRPLSDDLAPAEKLEVVLEMAKHLAVMHGHPGGPIVNNGIQIGQFSGGGRPDQDHRLQPRRVPLLRRGDGSWPRAWNSFKSRASTERINSMPPAPPLTAMIRASWLLGMRSTHARITSQWRKKTLHCYIKTKNGDTFLKYSENKKKTWELTTEHDQLLSAAHHRGGR